MLLAMNWAQMRNLLFTLRPQHITIGQICWSKIEIKTSERFRTTLRRKSFPCPFNTPSPSTPFKLRFLVTHWLSHVFSCNCFPSWVSVCVISGNRKMLFVWGQFLQQASEEGLQHHARKPGLRFCDYVALHHKELLSFCTKHKREFSLPGSELAQKS